MAKSIDPMGAVGSRYRALVNEHGLSQYDLDEFLSSKFPSERNKVSTFLREGVHASSSVRKALILFAKERLDLTLSESWFDADWHPSAAIERFVSRNSEYNSVLRQACGTYANVSKRARNEEGKEPVVSWRAVPLKIQDKGDYFCFEMGWDSEAHADRDHFIGYAVCHSDTIYLTGFDTKHHEKSIFIILRKAPRKLSDCKIKFYGLVVGTLPAGNMPNGRAIAKRVALVPETAWVMDWKDGKSVPESVYEWLVEEGSALSLD